MHADADVALFAKCLKNECDQEFKQVQDYVKVQIGEALRQVVREKVGKRTGEGDVKEVVDGVR